MSPPEHKATEYPEGMISDLNAAAAAAAATAIMSTAGMNPGADLNDAEADAEMEDDDQATGLHPQHHEHPGHTDHMDLNTAANILANGGNGTLPSGNGLQPDNQQQQQQQQQHHHQQMQAHQQQPQHHQPVPMGDPTQHLDANPHGLDPNFVRTTEELARDSGYGTLNVESALAKRLAREPGLRLAQQRRPEQQLNLGRRSNVEALFAHIAGDLAPSACKNCHKGHGPWTSCVVVDGQMCGSCANCWFNASGARCSFHGMPSPCVHRLIQILLVS
jgi:3-dehydrosphinganine reductase